MEAFLLSCVSKQKLTNQIAVSASPRTGILNNQSGNSISTLVQ